MNKSTFKVEQMDCPSEEAMIRMKLEPIKEVKMLDFDIPKRKVVVLHTDGVEEIEQAISSLNLRSSLVKEEEATDEEEGLILSENKGQKKMLWAVLAINFIFFVLEFTTGFISDSMGLVADSLDMLADAMVYGLSLFVVGAAMSRKKRIATISGYLQLILAIGGFIEVVRRFFGMEELPDFRIMIIVSFLALLANSLSLYLLQRAKSKEAHMQASMIFTSNDIIINSGVILAGILVFYTESRIPDLVVGGIVFVVVTRGAIRILKLGK